MKSTFILLALVLSASFCYAKSIHKKTANDDKILIEMYTESLCPDCIAFIKNSFSHAINTLNFFDIAELKLYPYGNAKEESSSGSYQYTC